MTKTTKKHKINKRSKGKAKSAREKKFIVQEFAATDPILSKIPTHEIVAAYEQMLRIAPEISEKKELVRTFLRQATTSQAINTFQGQDLINANTQLLRQHGVKLALNAKPKVKGILTPIKTNSLARLLKKPKRAVSEGKRKNTLDCSKNRQ